jgi:hypothetical protein
MTKTNSEQAAAEPPAVDNASLGETALQEHVLPPWESGRTPSIPKVDNDADHVSLNDRVL